MNKLAMMAVASLLAIAACSQEPATTDTTTTTETTTTSTDPMPTTGMTMQTAQDFANTAAENDMLEIRISELAQTKATNADVKAFAKEMVAAHTKTSTELKAWATSASGVTLPTTMSTTRMDLVTHLQEADTAGFDDRYLDTVIDAHEDAISAFESYSNNGDNAELKTWASTTLPTLRTHLDRANGIRAAINRS